MASAPKAKTTSRLGRDDWLSQALEVLAKDGQAGLRIQALCSELGVSRGSFYWHFKDRDDFIHAMLDYWHHEYTMPIPDMVEAAGGTGEEKLKRLLQMVYEIDRTRYDLAIRSWAVQDSAIAKAVQRTDRFRLAYIRALFAEMGFTAHELEVRTRTCLSYITLEKGLFDRISQRQRIDLVEDVHQFFVRKYAIDDQKVLN